MRNKKIQRQLVVRSNNAALATQIPLPLYVQFDPSNPKRVQLRFNTEEEAHDAMIYLNKLAGDHADRTRIEREKEGRHGLHDDDT